MTPITETIVASTPLQRELDSVAQYMIEVAPALAVATIDSGIASVEASGVAAHTLGIGDRAPDFTLPDAYGKDVTLATLVHQGPVVLTFYRGEWCPYCNVQLRAYQRALPDFAALGATLVAVSPQTPDNSLTTVEKKELTFPVLSDVGNRVAQHYHLVYRVDDTVQTTLQQLGIDLHTSNGDASGELPLTATFVIDRSGVIRWAYVTANFKQRPDPSEILAALAALA